MDQLSQKMMIRDPDTDGIKSCRDGVGEIVLLLQSDGKRSRSKLLEKQTLQWGLDSRILLYHSDTIDMDDDRIARGSAFGKKNCSDSVIIRRISEEPIDSFSGESHTVSLLELSDNCYE